MDDDEQSGGGGGTLVMNPSARSSAIDARRSAPHQQPGAYAAYGYGEDGSETDPDPHEPATLQRDIAVDPYTDTQLPVRVDPYAQRSGSGRVGSSPIMGAAPHTPAIPPPPPMSDEHSFQSHPALAAPPMVPALAALRPPSDPGIQIEREPEVMPQATGPNHTALIPVVPDPPRALVAEPAGPSNARRGLVAVAIGASLGLVVVVGISLIVLLVRGPRGPATVSGSQVAGAGSETPPAQVSSTESPAPSHASSVVAHPPPLASSGAQSTAPAAADTPDAAAIAALKQLRAAVEVCVRDKIRTLPGTSRAIPESLNHLKNGPYQPLARDWVAPFFSCTNFRLESPMPFMIQWQFQRPDTVGTGIAWIDEDQDGKADRAYAFTGKLTGKGVVELSEVEPTDAGKRPQKPR